MDRKDLAVMDIAFCLYGKGIDKLNVYQKTIVIINELEMEVNNGGFHQYYWNSSGNYANEVLGALKRVGAYKTAKIIADANLQFKEGFVPKDRDIRIEKLYSIEKEAKKRWGDCESEFYKNPDGITEMLIGYIIKNKAEIEK